MHIRLALLLPVLFLTACNHVHMKPGTLDKSQDMYTTRGGYNMRMATKEYLEQRGYNIKIGKIENTNNIVKIAIFLKLNLKVNYNTILIFLLTFL